jgi:hypothetical protein
MASMPTAIPASRVAGGGSVDKERHRRQGCEHQGREADGGQQPFDLLALPASRAAKSSDERADSAEDCNQKDPGSNSGERFSDDRWQRPPEWIREVDEHGAGTGRLPHGRQEHAQHRRHGHPSPSLCRWPALREPQGEQGEDQRQAEEPTPRLVPAQPDRQLIIPVGESPPRDLISRVPEAEADPEPAQQPSDRIAGQATDQERSRATEYQHCSHREAHREDAITCNCTRSRNQHDRHDDDQPHRYSEDPHP